MERSSESVMDGEIIIHSSHLLFRSAANTIQYLAEDLKIPIPTLMLSLHDI